MNERARERFLYVVGTSFTGSTLLSFLLNLHPQIVSVGECDPNLSNWPDPNQYPCSCGTTLAECPFWTAVGVEMSAHGMRFDPEHWRMSYNPGTRAGRRLLANRRADVTRGAVAAHAPLLGRHLREIARRNEALVAAARSVTGKPVFADASKSVSRVRLLASTTDLDPYVIHLVRDSLGFVASKKSRAGKNRRAARGGRIGNATRHWNQRSAWAEELLTSLPPSRRLRIRYEDFCENPEREFGRICDMLDLERIEGPYQLLASDHHIIGNRMRLSNSNEIVLDERWRSILTEEEATTVREATSRHRKVFGYG
ncbi:MAG: sulfotransferase [Solirubrobacterales bacterium]